MAEDVEAMEAVEIALEAPEKCTKQRAQIAEKKQKYPSNQKKEDRFTAETATKTTRNSN